MTTQQQYELLHKELNEQQWRLYLGTEALKIGYGGISQVAALSGADWKTVQRGVKELKGERARAERRIRQAGGGRKKATETDSTLQRDLEELLEPKGDPKSLVKWTTHSPFASGQGALASLGIASRRRLWPSCYTRRAIPSRSTRKRWKVLPTPTAISSLGTSMFCVSSSSRNKRQRSRSTVRRKNCWEGLRTRGANGSPKGKRRG
jgi:hypothetical protein